MPGLIGHMFGIDLFILVMETLTEQATVVFIDFVVHL